MTSTQASSLSSGTSATRRDEPLPRPGSVKYFLNELILPRHVDVLTLTLTPIMKKKKKVVKWASDVIDNEDLNKKSSKKCCIFHKQTVFGEWNDSDTEDEDEECNCHHN